MIKRKSFPLVPFVLLILCICAVSVFVLISLTQVTEGDVNPGKNCFSDPLETADWLEIFSWVLF